MTTPDGSLSPERDASDEPWESAPPGVPVTAAEAIEELTRALGELEPKNRDVLVDVTELLTILFPNIGGLP